MECEKTLTAAYNYVTPMLYLKRFQEAKSVLRKSIPVAQRVLGKSHYLTLAMKNNYANTLYRFDGATLDDLREAVTTLEETERIARRVLGCAHPSAVEIGRALGLSREALRAREETA